MALCTITDIYQSCDALPIPKATVRVFYQSPPVLDSLGGLIRDLPKRLTTDANGQFTIDVLPGADSIPSTAVLVFAFQSGEQVGGVVPDIPGPVDLPTLMQSHGWTAINGRERT